MFFRGFVASLGALALLSMPSVAQQAENGSYLNTMYSWQLPLPGCGTPDVFSSRAPFRIEGGRIIGTHMIRHLGEDALYIDELTDHPSGPLQMINYDYTCGACAVSGQIIVHGVTGAVQTFGDDENLHFYVRYSEPICQTDCPGTVMDFDCSYSEIVTDEFITPVVDGYVTERPANVKLNYAVHLD